MWSFLAFFTLLALALPIIAFPIPIPIPIGRRVTSNQVNDAAGSQGIGSESKLPPHEYTLPAAEVALSSSDSDKNTLGDRVKELGVSAVEGVREIGKEVRK